MSTYIFKEASKKPHWIQAMNKRLTPFRKGKTWDLVDLPRHKKYWCQVGLQRPNSMKGGRLKNIRKDLLPKDSQNNLVSIME